MRRKLAQWDVVEVGGRSWKGELEGQESTPRVAHCTFSPTQQLVLPCSTTTTTRIEYGARLVEQHESVQATV
jgi:hypothetical protein